MSISRKILASLIAGSLLIFSGASYPIDLVVTEINGVLLQDGKPVKDANLLGCADTWRTNAECVTRFETKTNSQGEFLFQQGTGISPSDFCSVCPCRPGVPSSCDPGWGLTFSILIDGRSIMFEDRGFGFGFKRLDVRCETKNDWLPTKAGYESSGRDAITPSPDLPHTRKMSMDCRIVNDLK